MDAAEQKQLEASGWKIGSADEFLGLTAVESACLDIRMSLARGLRARRVDMRLTQVDLARRLRSSQSSVAKMESGDPSVSLDLLIRSLLVLGLSRSDLASLM